MGLSARPVAQTASLISLGVNSSTGRPARSAATSAAPLAWPRRSVLCGFTLTKTRSAEARSGFVRSITFESSRTMCPSLAESSPSGTRIMPLSTRTNRPLAASMTPQPVRLRPGSRPRMRIVKLSGRSCPCRGSRRGRTGRARASSCRDRHASCASSCPASARTA